MSASRHCLTMSQAWFTGILVKRDYIKADQGVGWMVVLEMVCMKCLHGVGDVVLDCPTRGYRREARCLAVL